jgi:macrolide-specific efflux system membrane fusion protein
MVTRKDLKDQLTISGEVNASERTVLRFQSSGRLTWVGVKEGDYVKKGQLIAALDQREVQKRLQKYLVNYNNVRSDFDQKQDDNKEPNIWSLTDDQRREARRLGDKAQNNLNSAVLDVELQTLSIEYSNLVSPIDGLVIRVDAPVSGVNITPTQAEFEIANPQTLYFSALADQTEVVKLKIGQQADLAFDAYPETSVTPSFITELSYIPKQGETGTVYEVKLGFNPYGSSYRIGMTGDATLTLRQKNSALAVPSSFINTEAKRKYVYTMQDGKKKKVYVTTGEIFDTQTEIISGLVAGDTIYD